MRTNPPTYGVLCLHLFPRLIAADTEDAQSFLRGNVEKLISFTAGGRDTGHSITSNAFHSASVYRCHRDDAHLTSGGSFQKLHRHRDRLKPSSVGIPRSPFSGELRL